MSQRGQHQRNSRVAAVLATFVLLAAACSGADPSGDDIADDASSAPPTTTATESNNADAGESPTTAPPSADASPAPGGSEADAAILSDLPGVVAWRSAEGDIVTSSPGGTDREVWSSGDEFLSMQPTWAAEERVLAWSRSSVDNAEVATANVETGETTIVPTSNPPFYLSWSPDADRLLGLRNGIGGLETVFVDIDQQAVDTASFGQPFFSDWSSNDSLVAASSGLVIVDIDVNDLSVDIRDIDAPLGVLQTPVVLSGGDVIATTATIDSNEVSRITVDGTRTALASTDGPVVLSLSPDETRLAVLTIPVEGETEFISFTPGDARAQSELVQGELTELPAGVVSIIDLETGAIRSRSETDVVALNWSPTGDHLGLLRFRANELQWLFGDADDERSPAVESATFRPTTEFARSYLPFMDQYDRSSTWWSPDGLAFVFAGTTFGREGIWIDRIDDEVGPAFFAEGDIAFWSS